MQVKKMTGSAGKVFLPTEFIRRFALQETIYLTLTIGSLTKKVMCVPVDDGSSNVIYISEDIADETNLPENISYEVFAKNGKLYIGPVLGLMVSMKEQYLTPERLEHYLVYLEQYAEIKGLVIAFTLEGLIDQEKKVIGYAYEPHSKIWKRGVYVLPGAVYIRRAHVGLKIHNRLLNLVGDRFFNSYAFDKWEMWQWLSGSDEIRSHLPETVLLSDAKGIEKLLEKHKRIFLKPKRGYQGMGIYVLEKTEKDMTLWCGGGPKTHPVVFSDWGDLYGYMSEKLSVNLYLSQQMLVLIQIDDRVVDFRVIAQKGKYGNWQIQGIVSRQGPEQSMVSNVCQGGVAASGWSMLLNYYGMDDNVSFQKWAEIGNLVLKSCEQLESTGFRYGNLGFDIAIDINSHIWIIEINNIYPDHTIALDVNDSLLYKTVMTTPLLHAKWLSGFRQF
jgi:hypothetical protein